ncbi:MAG: TetR/AcrR family transcriptional regulator [Deltaproteobacteria bacterium]|nr:TetR/AcrR family transcriptional regulator [Deltaproteobacteria bacterium]
MARSKQYSNETIIEAARKMFLEKGPGVSTLDIAKEAGVSEGLLFKRFGTKQKLFVTAMGIPEFDPEKMLGVRLGKGDMRENLSKLTLELINIFHTMFPRMIMLWSQHKNATFEELHRHPEAPPIKFLRALEKYLSDETEKGRLAAVDPLITARTLLGAAVHYVFWDVVGLNQHVPLEAKPYAETVVDGLWQGIKPRTRCTDKRRRRRK